jgi:hypothetical protein
MSPSEFARRGRIAIGGVLGLLAIGFLLLRATDRAEESPALISERSQISAATTGTSAAEAPLVSTSSGERAGVVQEEVATSGVLHSDSGGPLAGASIQVFECSLEEVRNSGRRPELSLRTGPQGEFQFKAAARVTTISVEAPGHQDLLIEAPRGLLGKVLMKSHHRLVRVSGRVLGQDGPFTNFELRATNGSLNRAPLIPWTTYGGAGGRFELDLSLDTRSGETFVLIARAHGHAEARIQRSYRDTEPVELFLEPGTSIWGTVFGDHAEPIAGAGIEFAVDSYNDFPTIQSDAAGHFSFTLGLEEKVKSIWVFAPGYSSQLLRASSLPRHLEGLEINLSRGRTVTGMVLTSTGVPVEGAVVRLSWFGDPNGRVELDRLWTKKSTTDLSGEFSIASVPGELIQAAVVEQRNGAESNLCKPVSVDLRDAVAPPVLFTVGGNCRLTGTIQIDFMPSSVLWLELREEVAGQPDVVHSMDKVTVGDTFDLLGPIWTGSSVPLKLRIALNEEAYVERVVVLDAKRTAHAPIRFEPKDMVEFDRLGRRFEVR